MSLHTFARNNGLSIAMFGVFFVAIIGMSIAGLSAENNELQAHGQPELSYVSYIASGTFIESTFENWESEFLQMWALVMLTIYLYQKGSEDSKPTRGKTEQDTGSRYSIIQSATWRQRRRALKHAVYSHSLGLALLALFIMSFVLHALGGAAAFNEENQLHGEPPVSTVSYVATSQFWFESLQNWQSEFLAVGALTVLSVKLRERGSPQSKPVGKNYDDKTGK